MAFACLEITSVPNMLAAGTDAVFLLLASVCIICER